MESARWVCIFYQFRNARGKRFSTYFNRELFSKGITMKLRGINCKRHPSGDLTISVDILITGVCYRSTRTNFVDNSEVARNFFQHVAIDHKNDTQEEQPPVCL